MNNISRAQIWQSLIGLPHWVKLWLLVLMTANMSSLFFLDSSVGQWTAISFLVVGLVNMPMIYFQNGLTRLLSFPHLIWFGLLAYLLTQLFGQTDLLTGNLRNFVIIVIVINGISLVFDTLECIRWLKGNREVLGLKK